MFEKFIHYTDPCAISITYKRQMTIESNKNYPIYLNVIIIFQNDQKA